MTRLAVTAPLVFLPKLVVDGIVLIEGESIRAAGPRAEIEAPEGYEEVHFADGALTPGFVDIHVHGGGGADLMNATPEAMETSCRALARHGTTSFYATTETVGAALTEAIRMVTRNPAELAGVFWAEGPLGRARTPTWFGSTRA